MATLTAAVLKPILRLLGAAVFVVLAVGAAGWWSSVQMRETFLWVDRTHQVLYEIEATLAHAVSIQSGVRGFSLTGEERYLAPYEAGLVRIQQSVAKLKSLTADNARQQGRIAHLASLIDEELAVMKQRLLARRQGGLAAASAATSDGRGKQVVDAIRGVVAAMEQEERALLAERTSSAQFHRRVSLAILTVGLLAVVVLVDMARRRLRHLGAVS